MAAPARRRACRTAAAHCDGWERVVVAGGAPGGPPDPTAYAGRDDTRSPGRPELAHVLARVIHRIRAGQDHVPLVARQTAAEPRAGAVGLERPGQDDVLRHHAAFIARRRTERPGEEYREPTPTALASAGLRFVERERATVRLPVQAANLAPSCGDEDGRIDAPPHEVVHVNDPDMARKINAGWFRLAVESGLFTEQREFLLEVDYSDTADEPELAWVRVQLLDQWDVAGSGVAALGTYAQTWLTQG